MLEDHRSANIPANERALFDFLETLTARPGAVRREEVEALRAIGWSDEAIYDAVSVSALFAFYNRWIEGTGVQDLPAAGYAISGKRLADGGYE